jgi:predicted membrane protein
MTQEQFPSSTSPSSPPPTGAWGPGPSWARDGRGRDRRPCRHRHGHGTHGVVPGLVVVAWGGLLLAREYGLVDRSLHAMAFWPLILVGFGILAVVRRRSFASVVVGLAVGLFGAALLAERLGLVVVGLGHLWPLIVVAIGLGLLWQGFRRRSPARPEDGMENETVSADELRRDVTMGGLALVIDSQQFKGGTLRATMSGVQLDLRRAAMAGEEVQLDLTLFMSGLEVHVPTHWRIVNDLTPFMGAVEDRTEPRPDGSGVQRRLVLRGSLTMGAVTIKN